jgi:hypothetical protein
MEGLCKCAIIGTFFLFQPEQPEDGGECERGAKKRRRIATGEKG